METNCYLNERAENGSYVEKRNLVYETLQGVLTSEYMLPGVENLFEPDKPCYEHYSDMRRAYDRLLERLGKTDEDEDIEAIISAMQSIETIMAIKMFDYGVLFERLQMRER